MKCLKFKNDATLPFSRGFELYEELYEWKKNRRIYTKAAPINFIKYQIMTDIITWINFNPSMDK